jgi:peptidoglycan/xylan/chitin deacetylase (PgdA/CDA1 family)
MIPILPIATSLLSAPFFLGAAGAALFGRSLADTTPGLLFHSLDLKSGLSLSALSSARFETIIRHLSDKGYHSFTLAQTDARGRSNTVTGNPARSVNVTFDDGCRSFFSRALPILDRSGFKTTMFPVAGYLGKSSSWDVLPPFPHLTKEEIREISDLGHEIGSHGLTHSDFTRLETADLKTELADSKKILEDVTGKEVTSLSFPFGCWNHRVWDCAQEAGYLSAAVYRQHRNCKPGLFPVYGV